MNTDQKAELFADNFESALYHLENGLNFLNEAVEYPMNPKGLQEAIDNLNVALTDLKQAESLKRGFSYIRDHEKEILTAHKEKIWCLLGNGY